MFYNKFAYLISFAIRNLLSMQYIYWKVTDLSSL